MKRISIEFFVFEVFCLEKQFDLKKFKNHNQREN